MQVWPMPEVICLKDLLKWRVWVGTQLTFWKPTHWWHWSTALGRTAFHTSVLASSPLCLRERAEDPKRALQPLRGCLGVPLLLDCSFCRPSYPPLPCPKVCFCSWLFSMQTSSLFFQSEWARRRNVIKFKSLMKYLILHHFLCFYLVSKTEPIYKQRPWNIGLGGPTRTNKKEALGQHVSSKEAKAELKRESCASKVTQCWFSWEPGVPTVVGKGTLGTASLVQGWLTAVFPSNLLNGLCG